MLGRRWDKEAKLLQPGYRAPSIGIIAQLGSKWAARYASYCNSKILKVIRSTGSLYRRSLGHHGQPVSRFNPPEWNMGDEANSENAMMMLADSIVIRREGKTDPILDDEAEALLTASFFLWL
jgi:hypothetical protein